MLVGVALAFLLAPAVALIMPLSRHPREGGDTW
jgi:hypothetical protein